MHAYTNFEQHAGALTYEKSLSESIVLIIRVACFANLLEIKSINIRFIVHQVVTILTFNLHSTISLPFVFYLHCHIISTHVLVVACSSDTTRLTSASVLYQDLVLLEQVQI